MKILIIENESKVLSHISEILSAEWPLATLESTKKGAEGIEMVKSKHPDVVLLDIGVKDVGGLQVVEHIRLISDVPIILLSVKMGEEDEVRGLDMGADDYIVIPFNEINFTSRTMVMLRRAGVLS